LKLYGRTDIDEVTTPFKDGTSHRHVRTKKMNKEDGTPGPFVLDCEACSARMIEMDPGITTKSLDGTSFTTHWTPNVRMVPQSEAEKQAKDEAEEQFLRGNVSDFQEFQEFQRQKRRGKPINVGVR
jgi:hypothetical protein